MNRRLVVYAVAAAICISAAISAGAQSSTRYFKEDHLTGADYIALAGDGRYTVINREHTGIRVVESGHWKQSGRTIHFLPDRRATKPYDAAEATHRAHLFLAFTSEAARGKGVSADTVRRQLDQRPGELPSYVFFEVTKAVYDRESKETYPLRTRRR